MLSVSGDKCWDRMHVRAIDLEMPLSLKQMVQRLKFYGDEVLAVPMRVIPINSG